MVMLRCIVAPADEDHLETDVALRAHEEMSAKAPFAKDSSVLGRSRSWSPVRSGRDRGAGAAAQQPSAPGNGPFVSRRCSCAVPESTREASPVACTSWHELVLSLIARHAGAAAAREVARLFAFHWHQDGIAAYRVFEGRTDHGDAEVKAAQEWLATHFSVANPVEQMIRRSRLAERTFKRRFTAAIGLPPIAYVQRLRIEDAKRRLERTDASVEEVSWRVGYEDAAFFRRLFRRMTGLAPGAYRKRFRVPDVPAAPRG